MIIIEYMNITVIRYGGITMIKKVLFLCTANSARSQIAEALLNIKGYGKFIAYSAGSHPTERIDPYAQKVMEEIAIDLSEHKPKSIQQYMNDEFDFVITLCDRMRNECPSTFKESINVYWGIPDPKDFDGTEEEKLRYFKDVRNQLVSRINLFLSIPIEKLDKAALKQRLNSILDQDGNNYGCNEQ